MLDPYEHHVAAVMQQNGKHTPAKRLAEDFDRLFGDAWQPTMPAKPEPMPVPPMPVPEFPAKDGGREL